MVRTVLYGSLHFFAVAFTAALILQPPNLKLYAVVALSAGLIAIFLFFTMNQRLTAERLIVENQILHIQPAILRERISMKESEAEP